MGFGRIKGITIEIDGDTTKLVDSIKKVDSQLRQTQNALRDTNKLLKLDPGNADLLVQKQKQLEQAIKQTKERLQQLREAQSHVDEGTAEWDALQREIIETEQKLNKLEAEYKQFGSVAAQQVAAAGEKLKDIGGKMSDIGQDLTMKVTVPLTAAGTVAAKKFADVDKTMQLTNKTMGNTQEQAKLLDKAMKDAAANSVSGMSDAATATLNFARAGLTAEQAASTLAPAMNLAAGEGGNLDTVSAGLVATINGFGDSFDKATNYADIFANACNNSALDINSLSESMSIAAPIFSAAGYKINDAALYMGVMANAGIDANKAATSLKTGMARLVSPSKDAAAWMEKLGIEVTNSDGSMKDSITVQRELHDAFAGLSESEQIAAASAIFGKNQMSNWLALINTAPSDVSKLSKQLQVEGTTAEMAAAQMAGFGGSMESLKSSIDVAAVSLGEALAPTILKVSEFIQRLVDWFNSLSEKQQQMIAKIGLIVAAIGPVLLIGGKLLIGIGQLMTFAPKILAFGSAVTKAFTLVKGAVAALSFNPVVLGIGAAVAAGVLIYKNWDKIKAKAEELKQAISEKWNNIKETVSQKAQEISDNATQKAQTMKNGMTAENEAARQATQQKWEDMKNSVSTKAEEMKTAVNTKFENMKTEATTKYEALKTNVTSKAEALKSAVDSKLDSLKTSASSKWESMKSTASSAWDSMKSTASSKFDSIKNAISDKMDAAKDAVANAVKTLKSKLNFSWSLPKLKLPHVSVSGKFSLNPPSTPKFSISWYKKAYKNAIEFPQAMVLPTAGGLKGFGDGRGSEIVWGKQAMLNTIKKAVGPTGNYSYTFNIYAQPGQDVKAIAREVENIMIQQEKQRRSVYA